MEKRILINTVERFVAKLSEADESRKAQVREFITSAIKREVDACIKLGIVTTEESKQIIKDAAYIHGI